MQDLWWNFHFNRGIGWPITCRQDHDLRFHGRSSRGGGGGRLGGHGLFVSLENIPGQVNVAKHAVELGGVVDSTFLEMASEGREWGREQGGGEGGGHHSHLGQHRLFNLRVRRFP